MLAHTSGDEGSGEQPSGGESREGKAVTQAEMLHVQNTYILQVLA